MEERLSQKAQAMGEDGPARGEVDVFEDDALGDVEMDGGEIPNRFGPARNGEVGDLLGDGPRNGDDIDAGPGFLKRLGEFLHRENRFARDRLANEFGFGVESGADIEPHLAESREIEEGPAEMADADQNGPGRIAVAQKGFDVVDELL